MTELPLSLETLLALLPGHCALLIFPSFWPLLLSPFLIPPLFLRAGLLRALSLYALIRSHGITYHPRASDSQTCVSSPDVSHVFQPHGSNHPLDFLNISNFPCQKDNKELIVSANTWYGSIATALPYFPSHLPQTFPRGHPPHYHTLSRLVNGSAICVSTEGRNPPPSPASGLPHLSPGCLHPRLSIFMATICSHLHVHFFFFIEIVCSF